VTRRVALARVGPLVPAVVVAALLLGPAAGLDAFWQRQLTLVAALSLVVSGLNLSMGWAGEFALGQGALYAAGAYTAGALATRGHDELLVGIVAGAFAALVAGVVAGAPGLRLGGWSLAMVSFFLVLLLPDVIRIFDEYTGGFIGLSGVPRARLFGHRLTNEGFYRTAVVVAGVWFVAVRNLLVSRHGAAFRVLRESPVLASSLGISPYRMKLLAYGLGAVPAGIGGALFVYTDRFIAPQSFGFDVIIGILAASILGGAQTVYGAVVGAALLQIVPVELSSIRENALIVYGAFLVLGGVFLSGGLGGGAQAALRRMRTMARPNPAQAVPTTVAGSLAVLEGRGQVLEVRDVVKRFGGVAALEHVDLVAGPGRVTALIGPNGSGKTTLLNMISGFYRPDRGAVLLGGRDVAGRTPTRIARFGVARTFQTPLIPEGLTAGQVVATARYHAARTSMASAVLRLGHARRREFADRRDAATVMTALGIGDVVDVPARSLPLGTRRLVELARAVASGPSVVLLDEVASGLDDDALARLRAGIEAIRDAGVTVVLVEHNFELVTGLADTVYVLSRGEVVASGDPAAIVADPRVRREYLGIEDVGATEPEAPAARPGATVEAGAVDASRAGER
jgi:branched-chain amino acid transport system permease protein